MVQQLKLSGIAADLTYPDSDGKPLADNTIQFHLIMKIQGGIDSLFRHDPKVFVSGDLLWYPVEGSLSRQAPDVMVVFGRPKGDRGSYQQWREGNISPQVAFEILSPGNTRKEMERKFEFYQLHGIEEYFVYDPSKNLLLGWLKQGNQLLAIPQMEGWVSPRLGITFRTETGSLELYGPDGHRFQAYVEVVEYAEQASQRAEQASQRAEQESQRAEQESQRAEQESQARYDSIPRLLGMGLSVPAVAAGLGFSVKDIEDFLLNDSDS